MAFVVEISLTCTTCGREHWHPYVARHLGGVADSVRVAGWRIGPPGPDQVMICPRCAGQEQPESHHTEGETP